MNDITISILGYLKVRIASPALALFFTNPEHQVIFICALFGVLGGGILQLLTWDERRPTWKFVCGDLLSSGVLGFGTAVMSSEVTSSTFFYCILAGFGGSGIFVSAVKKYSPTWLPKE